VNVPGPAHSPQHPSRRRRLASATVAGALFVGLLGAGQGVASAQSATTPAPPAPTSTAPVRLPSPDIIPAPNSGHAPRDAGERGGSQQTLLFALVCLGLATLAGLIWRDSRRKLAAARARVELASTSAPSAGPADSGGGTASTSSAPARS
jgi:hypothetical protein